MGDSQQGTKKRIDYKQWTKLESDALLELMVDAASRGWRDNNGVFTKQIVEQKILPVLNSKLGCQKNYNNYQSRLRWFKNRWLSFSTLLRFNSGFRFDLTTKSFTAPNNVWDDYLKVHPKDVNLRYGVFEDYEDLKIAIRNGIAVGKNSIGLGNNTDSRTLRIGEDNYMCTDDLNYDSENDVYVVPTQNDSSFHQMTPIESPEGIEVPKKKIQTKRDRTDLEGSSTSKRNTPQSGVLKQLTKLITTFDRVYSLLEKREREKTYTTWDAIKEIPNLHKNIRFEAFDLLDTKTKKDGFLKMSLEERRSWIFYKMKK